MVAHAGVGLHAEVHLVWSELAVLMTSLLVTETLAVCSIQAALKLILVTRHFLNHSAIFLFEFA